MFNFKKKPELKGLYRKREYAPEHEVVITKDNVAKILKEYLEQQGVKIPENYGFLFIDSSFTPRVEFYWRGERKDTK